MELRKTSILPEGREAACREMERLIHDEPEVLFVVLGDNREQLVSRAGKFAGGEDDLRWVVWVRRPDEVRDVLASLRGPQEFLNHVLGGRAQAFTLSYSDALADVIKTDETVDNVRVVQAFVRAERVA